MLTRLPRLQSVVEKMVAVVCDVIRRGGTGCLHARDTVRFVVEGGALAMRMYFARNIFDVLDVLNICSNKCELFWQFRSARVHDKSFKNACLVGIIVRRQR